MLNKLRRRAGDERGFTLIELLVVILIIGILAAIAIPSFLAQKSKANDASAKELARTAQTTAETVATDHNGDYSFTSVASLYAAEPSIPTVTGSNAWLSAAAAYPTPTSTTGYTVTTTSVPTGNTFTIQNAAGIITRTCTIPTTTSNAGGCQVVTGTAAGTW